MKGSINSIFDRAINRVSQQNPVDNDVSEIIKEPVVAINNEVITYMSPRTIILVVLGMVFVFGGIVLKLTKKHYYVKDEVKEEEEEVEDVKAISEADISKEAPKKDVTPVSKEKTPPNTPVRLK